MKEFILPDNLLNGASFTTYQAVCFPHSTGQSSVKNRIILEAHLFSFLQEGEKSVFYAGGSQTITPEHFFFLPSGNCLMSEKTAVNGCYRSNLLLCGQELLASFFREFYPDRTSEYINYSNRLPIVIAYDPFIRSFVDSLSFVNDADADTAAQMLRFKVKELLTYLCKKQPHLVGYFKGLCHEWSEENELRKVVYAHIESTITIPELAFLCNMSLSTFKRKFARVFGSTPKQWFLQQRMDRAAELLKNDGLKVSEVYMRFGYENLSSFIQAFKQHFGTTPKQYQVED